MTRLDHGKDKVVVAEIGKVIYDSAFHDAWVCTVLYASKFFFFISGTDDRQAMFERLFFPVLI